MRARLGCEVWRDRASICILIRPPHLCSAPPSNVVHAILTFGEHHDHRSIDQRPQWALDKVRRSILLRRYVKKVTPAAPTLRGKKLHPHSVRHSTAVALLKAGVDFATISHWLGHAGRNTTMRYARADLDLKRQAPSQVFPVALAPPRTGRLLIDGSDVVGWLRRL